MRSKALEIQTDAPTTHRVMGYFLETKCANSVPESFSATTRIETAVGDSLETTPRQPMTGLLSVLRQKRQKSLKSSNNALRTCIE